MATFNSYVCLPEGICQTDHVKDLFHAKNIAQPAAPRAHLWIGDLFDHLRAMLFWLDVSSWWL